MSASAPVGSIGSNPQPEPADHPQPGISRCLVLLLAVVGGASVANLYYAQPLLPTIANALGVSDSAAGLLVTLSQLGYAAASMSPCLNRQRRRRQQTQKGAVGETDSPLPCT
ncbi:MAG: hypothetical protein ACRDPW_08210 [Mycobacteriales bacterium]